MRTTSRARCGVTLVEVLVVIAILALMIGLLLPAVQQVRGAAARMSCSSNVRQQGVALANYHAALGRLPPGKVPHAGSTEKHPDMSWLTHLLPYIEQDAVWREALEAYSVQPDYTVTPTVHPIGTVIRIYTCPADDRLRQPHVAREKVLAASTSYLGVSGRVTAKREGTFFDGSVVRYTDMTDGTSNTVVIGERPPSSDFWYGWWYAGYGSDGSGKGDMLLGTNDGGSGADPYTLGCEPLGFTPGNFSNYCHTLHFWSLHPGGANFGFGDGSVRFLRYSAATILPSLATRAGSEVVELPE